MSELKHQLMLNKDMSWVPCYLKSEADKVIAHHKRKRCLAMARWCYESEQGFELLGNIEYDAKCRLHLYFISNNRKKWRKRWLALAEEPTWAKFLQLIHKEVK